MIMPTEKENKVIRESILYPFLLQVIDRDKVIIENSTLKLRETYADIFDNVSNKVFADMRKINDEIRSMGIKIYKQSREKDGVRFRFVCRRYHNDGFYRWVDLKEDIKLRIRFYFGE